MLLERKLRKRELKHQTLVIGSIHWKAATSNPPWQFCIIIQKTCIQRSPHLSLCFNSNTIHLGCLPACLALELVLTIPTHQCCFDLCRKIGSLGCHGNLKITHANVNSWPEVANLIWMKSVNRLNQLPDVLPAMLTYPHLYDWNNNRQTSNRLDQVEDTDWSSHRTDQGLYNTWKSAKIPSHTSMGKVGRCLLTNPISALALALVQRQPTAKLQRQLTVLAI